MKKVNEVYKSYAIYGLLSDEFINKNILESGDRVINQVGSLLDIHADGPKKPIPFALGLDNNIRSTVVSMIGLGLGHNFSLGFAHLGSIRRASMELDKATRGITENIETKRHYFNTYLNIELSKLKGQYNNRRYDSDKLVIYRDTENLNLTRDDRI